MSRNGTVSAKPDRHIKVRDVYLMAVKLLARHGSVASDVAAFAEKEHELRGDAVRHAAWTAVRSTVSDMLANRMPVDGVRIH